jgi:GTP pyrophosphokinase
MQERNLEFEQIHDLLAFRVLVDELGQCYTALGFVHSLFHPLPDRIKDYIATPKSNGYQSLHTVVLGPGHRQVEIQIRTREMHHVAEVGIAAHWRYKEGQR